MEEGHSSLPHWNLTSIYPSLGSDAFRADYETWTSAITDLKDTFDTHRIDLPDSAVPINAATLETLETVIEQLNATQRLGRQLQAYVTGFVTTDSSNSEAQVWMSRLQMALTELEKLEPRFIAWLGGLDLDLAFAESPLAQAHTFMLRHAKIESDHLMPPVAEDLAADLNQTGGRAWSKFYNNFSSQITAEVEVEGAARVLPMPAIRNLASAPDRALRRRAYEVELHAWEANAMPIAAALNSIKGQANVLYTRRKWISPLDVALHNNHIDHATLDAMMETARTFFPHFRRYLQAKARALGINRCAWYDLFAPVGAFERTWTFEAARQFIKEQFATFAPSLADLARRAFDEGWIDAEPRKGKRGGAFCMWVRDDESRILANYQQAYGGVSTLAHELGHAYHNFNLADRTYLQRRTPMTLAETASTFCQIIVRNAALEEASPQEQLAILEADLQDATQVVVDISCRFIFEHEVFQRRRQQELAVEELCEIMADAQEATYGDGLSQNELHPYMWAAKPHYYSAVFYNFPYMFGLLFSLGVYAQYRRNPQGFVDRYEALLSSTGMNDAATLAKRFDIDITRPAFWESSLQLIADDIDRFIQLVDADAEA